MTKLIARHIERCNSHNLQKFLPFIVGGKHVGYISPPNARVLLSLDNGFTINQSGAVALCDPPFDHDANTNAKVEYGGEIQDIVAKRSAILAQATAALVHANNSSLRNELYPVVTKHDDPPLAVIDRVAIPWFGLPAFGVHLNGYVRRNDELLLWVGKRAADRPLAPNKLDNIVGGGIPLGISVADGLIKEASEEASLPPEIVRQAIPVGRLSYCHGQENILRRDTLFVFDLELPDDIIPHNADGEVAEFNLLPARDVLSILRDTDDFKFNCAVLAIDFLIRHGILDNQDREHQDLTIKLQSMRELLIVSPFGKWQKL